MSRRVWLSTTTNSSRRLTAPTHSTPVNLTQTRRFSEFCTRFVRRYQNRTQCSSASTLSATECSINGSTKSHSFYSRTVDRMALAASSMVLGTTLSLSLISGVAADNGSGDKARLYTWGFNQYGQLGIGSENNESSPILVDSLLTATDKPITQITCGAEQTAVLTDAGEVFTFGRGQDSRLGHGSSGGTNETSPRIVEELIGKKVTYIDSGFMHMACVTSDGAVYTWGKSTYNQLGHSGEGLYPQMVTSLSDQSIECVKVSCGRYHTVALTKDGKCYAWGGYKSGETGTGQKKSCKEPLPVIGLPKDDPIIDVKCGQSFTLFLTEKGSVYSCGSNDQGQCGHGSTRERYILKPARIQKFPNPIISICAGHVHAMAVDNQGSVYAWGSNNDGQLGLGDTQNRTTPEQISPSNFGGSDWNAVLVGAGGGHSSVVCQNSRSGVKQIFTFGRGRQGQIGRGDHLESVAAYRAQPVQVDFFDGITQECQVAQVALGGQHSAVLCV